MTREQAIEVLKKALECSSGDMYATVSVGTEEERTDVVARLLDIIASLHNELCYEVEGKYCDYAYHWANLGYGGCPNDSMFKEKEGEAE